MNMKELQNKLLEVEHRLKNNLTKKVILDYLKDYINYDDVQKSIKSYLENFETMEGADNEEAYEISKGLIKHLNHFIENTKDATRINLYHMQLLDDMNFFIEHSFNKINSYTKDEQQEHKMYRVRIQEIADEAGASNALSLLKKLKS